MQTSTGFRLLITLTVIGLLSACGFTLRGSAELPLALQSLQVQSADPNSAFVRELRRVLRNNKVVLDAGGVTDYRLQVGSEQFFERALSVNSQARAGEYELSMSVQFQLNNSETILIEPEIITLEKVYLADPENAVAKTDEAKIIQQEMRRELALQILRRLQALVL